MKNLEIKHVLLALIFMMQTPVAQEEILSPEYVVRNVVSNVLDVLNDQSLDENHKRFIVYGLISNHIHFEEMSRRILGPNWKTLTDTQKIKFINLFKQNLLNDYWVRVKQYSGEKVKYVTSTQNQDGFASVDTVIEREDREVVIPVSYRLKYTGLEWLAYDFLVENLSLVQNYHREYAAIMKNSGIKGLLKHMHREMRNFK